MVLAEGDGNNQEAEIEEETEKIVVVGAIRKEDEGSEMDGPAPPPEAPPRSKGAAPLATSL
jgi:hypothetical protein